MTHIPHDVFSADDNHPGALSYSDECGEHITIPTDWVRGDYHERLIISWKETKGRESARIPILIATTKVQVGYQ